MRILLLSVAAIIAVFAGMVALQLSSKKPEEAPATAVVEHAQNVATVDILVARTPVPAGTIITSAMLDTQPWPENLVLKQFIVSGSPDANIVGKVARASLQEREPFIASKLANTNDPGFLAATLPAGTRAVTIATDAVSGVAGFVYPGDRVDVIFTHNLGEQNKSDKQGNDRPTNSEVLVANVPVLAVNLREQPSKTEGGVISMAANTAPIAPSSITLQMSPTDAENIRLAEKIGTLSVTLRSLKDIDNQNSPSPTNLSSLTHVDLSKAPEEDTSVKVTKR